MRTGVSRWQKNGKILNFFFEFNECYFKNRSTNNCNMLNKKIVKALTIKSLKKRQIKKQKKAY